MVDDGLDYVTISEPETQERLAVLLEDMGKKNYLFCGQVKLRYYIGLVFVRPKAFNTEVKEGTQHDN